MKKLWLALGLLLASGRAAAQPPADSAYSKQTIARTAIQLLLSHYSQDGRHSAVTGGTGTEALVVFAPELTVVHEPDSTHTLRASGGVDVITSASTDRIDYVVSSASRVDMRTHLTAAYSQRLRDPRIRVGLQSGFSLESDYFSLPVGLTVTRRRPDGSREATVGIQAFFDDLRWGRINPDYYRPVQLIYPSELRYREWFSTYRRTSFNLTTTLTQVINRRLQVALYPELAYQYGLLSTPFHRVYFNDSAQTLRVENLPRTRWKLPLGAQLSWFATDRIVIRAYYRYYWDSFGLSAHTAQVEAPVRLASFLTVSPLVRLYWQTAARYFRPYAGHSLSAAFYTSDYDLSTLTTADLGLTLRYAPHQPLGRTYASEAVSLRYLLPAVRWARGAQCGAGAGTGSGAGSEVRDRCTQTVVASRPQG